VDGSLDLGAVARGDLHRAVVLDIDLRASLFDDFADDLAARPDHLADLVGRNLHRLDARGEIAELWTRGGDGSAHLIDHIRASDACLSEHAPHFLLIAACDLVPEPKRT